MKNVPLSVAPEMIENTWFLIALCFIIFEKSIESGERFTRLIFDNSHVSTSTVVPEGYNWTTTHKDQNTTSTSQPTEVPKHSHPGVADIAIAVITVIALAIILAMSIYFVRKFEQLNRHMPSYRYSALKTEVNGINGNDDRMEAQALVNASTEEEDDFDEEEEVSSPPTLFIHSQTTMTSSKSDSVISLNNDQVKTFPRSAQHMRETISIDSDDELLQ